MNGWVQQQENLEVPLGPETALLPRQGRYYRTSKPKCGLARQISIQFRPVEQPDDLRASSSVQPWQFQLVNQSVSQSVSQ